MKIDKKINALFTAIIIVLSILLAVSFAVFEFRHMNKSMDERARIILDNLAANIEFPLFVRNVDEVKRIINVTMNRESVAYGVLADNEGNTICEAGNYSVTGFKVYKKTVFKHSSMGEGEEVLLGIPSESTEQLGSLSLSFSTEETKKSVTIMLFLTFLFTIFVIFIASYISSSLIKSILGNPISLLVESTQKISGGDFNYKVPIDSRDEIGKLAEAFNSMTFKLSISLVSKDYMESIFASMVEVLMVANNDGNIEMANEAAVKMIGYSKEELNGKLITDFFEKVSLADMRGNMMNVETKCLAKTGKIPVLFGSSALKDKEGHLNGFACVAVDITKIKEAETKLINAMEKIGNYNEELQKTAEKLKELDKMKSDFISMVSHELRTPVTSIKGYLSFLMKGLGGQVTAAQLDFLTSISRNTERLLRIINDLLDITKIEVGSFAVNRSYGDIVRVMNNSLNEMAPLFETINASIIKKYDLNVMSSFVDEYRMSQVFINILNNSIKFAGNNSKFTIDIKKTGLSNVEIPASVILKPSKSGFYCYVSIMDEGVGIEKANLEKVFDRFYQVEDLNTRKYQGLGLGLNITKSIVSAHDGVIWASSEGKGKGTTFNILLPFEEKPGLV